jgi:hypothetical protein
MKANQKRRPPAEKKKKLLNSPNVRVKGAAVAVKAACLHMSQNITIRESNWRKMYVHLRKCGKIDSSNNLHVI